MRRMVSLSVLCAVMTGCPSYDRYSPVSDQDGLVPADRFARYGTEQAQAIAIGRALGAAFTGRGREEYPRQISQAADYAEHLPDVVSVVADTQAYLLTVTFRSGWRKAILPISDGVPADRTPGLPQRR